MTQKDESTNSPIEKLGTSEVGVVGTRNAQLKDLLTENAENNLEEEAEQFDTNLPISRESSEVIDSVDEAHLASLVEEIGSAPPKELRPNLDPHVAEALKATPRRPNANASLMSIITAKHEESNEGEETPVTPPLPAMSAEEAARLTEPKNKDASEEHGGVEELEELLANAEEPQDKAIDDHANAELPPGYWQGFKGKYGRLNVFAYLGVVFLFVFFPLGFFMSLIGLNNAREVPDDKVGKIVAWVGMGLSSLLAVILLVYIVLAPILWGLQLFPYILTGTQP